MHQIELTPTSPYDFNRMSGRLRQVGHELYRHEGEALIRTVRIGGRVYWVRIRSVGEVDSPKLLVDIGGVEKDSELPAISEHLQHMLSTKAKLDELYERLRRDAVLAPLADRYYGFRFILESDLFECMVKTIIGQQLNLAFAATLTRRLIETVSPPYIRDGVPYPVFPTAEQVASLTVADLRELQFSRRKAEYVIDFAKRVAAGELDLDELRTLDNGQIMQRLLPLRGIGRWTVECFLLFGLGRTDLLPAADIGLRNAVRRLYGLGHQPLEDEVRRIGADWSPWSSYVTYYMWESLNDPWFRV